MRINRVGPRILTLAVLVGLAPIAPGTVVSLGPIVGFIIWLTGAPGTFRTDRVFWIATAMVGWMYLTTTWAINPASWQPFYFTASLAVTFLFGRHAIRTLQQTRIVAYAYIISVFGAVVRALVENQGLLTQNATTGVTARLSVGDLNANYLGYSLVGGLAVIVFLWATAETRKAKAWLLVASVGIFVGLQITGTRGAALGALILAIWVIACWIVKRPPFAALVLAVTSMSVIIATGSLEGWLRSLDYGDRATGDLSGRLNIWPVARTLWDESWLVGSGPWAMRASTNPGIDAHNFILEIGSAQGIIGVALFIALLVAALWWDNRDADPRFRKFIIGAFIAASAPAYLSGAWETTAAAWVLLMIMSRIGAPALTPEVQGQPQSARLHRNR